MNFAKFSRTPFFYRTPPEAAAGGVPWKIVFINIAKSAGKHLWWSHFVIKVASFSPATLLSQSASSWKLHVRTENFPTNYFLSPDTHSPVSVPWKHSSESFCKIYKNTPATESVLNKGFGINSVREKYRFSKFLTNFLQKNPCRVLLIKLQALKQLYLKGLHHNFSLENLKHLIEYPSCKTTK